MAKRSRDEIAAAVDKAAAVLELDALLDRKPAELSGGQRQRVAMGRAIVRQPAVFLFDEPLSNLDAQLRMQMRIELRKMHLQLKTTTIYVTHDQIEAMTLADRIVILKDGHIQQVGTPVEVFEQPANVFVAQFIGNPPHEHPQRQSGTARRRALFRPRGLVHAPAAKQMEKHFFPAVRYSSASGRTPSRSGTRWVAFPSHGVRREKWSYPKYWARTRYWHFNSRART